MKYDVFISYRRSGGSEKAELVKTELVRRGYKADRVFMDTHSLGSGNYVSSLADAISDSINVVVIVTAGCFDGLTEESNMTKELKTALSLSKNIVPVYFDGITEVNPDGLPESIRSFPRENAVRYVHDYSEASFDRLCSYLRKESRTVPKWAKWTAAAVAAAAAAGGVADIASGPGNLGQGEVYVIETTTSKCYHVDKNCPALGRSSKTPKVVTLEEALDMGKRPCSKCCE